MGFKVLDMNIDTSTPTGALQFNLLASIYQFEREIMLERQKVGIAKAKKEGRFAGRVPTARRKTDDIIRLTKEGMKPSEIAKTLGIEVASVYRYRSAHELQVRSRK